MTAQTKTKAETSTAGLLDVAEVAAMLPCSKRHVYRLSDSGRMPTPIKLGALVRWSHKAVLDWIESDCPSVRRAGCGR